MLTEKINAAKGGNMEELQARFFASEDVGKAIAGEEHTTSLNKKLWEQQKVNWYYWIFSGSPDLMVGVFCTDCVPTTSSFYVVHNIIGPRVNAKPIVNDLH